MTPLNIRTCFKPHKTLRSLLVRAKNRTPTSAKSGIVYQVPCGSCSETYIGQSGRTLTHRLKNTRGLSLQQILPTAVAEHAIKFEHSIDWDHAKVIDSHPQLYPRRFLESWHIKSKASSMNRDEGLLPPVYNIRLQQA